MTAPMILHMPRFGNFKTVEESLILPENNVELGEQFMPSKFDSQSIIDVL